MASMIDTSPLELASALSKAARKASSPNGVGAGGIGADAKGCCGAFASALARAMAAAASAGNTAESVADAADGVSLDALEEVGFCSDDACDVGVRAVSAGGAAGVVATAAAGAAALPDAAGAATAAGATTAGAAAAPGDHGDPGGPPPTSTAPFPALKGCSGDLALRSNTDDTGVRGGSDRAGVAPPSSSPPPKTASSKASGSAPRSCFRGTRSTTGDAFTASFLGTAAGDDGVRPLAQARRNGLSSPKGFLS